MHQASHPPKPVTSRVKLNRIQHHCRALALFVMITTMSACGFGDDSHESYESLGFITTCEAITPSTDVILGIGSRGFETVDAVSEAKIVQGFQGGHHLWGALRFSSVERFENAQAIQLVACLDGELIADSSYRSIDYLPGQGVDLYGLAIIFLPSVNVTQIDGRQLALTAAVQIDGDIHFSTASTTAKCCGHVADGD